jgi:hypothetical protein
MTLPLEVRWLLNERKLQKQENGIIKKSLVLSKFTAITSNKKSNFPDIPSQYARVKNIVKVEEVIKDDKDQKSIVFVEFLEGAIKVQVFMKQIKM